MNSLIVLTADSTMKVFFDTLIDKMIGAEIINLDEFKVINLSGDSETRSKGADFLRKYNKRYPNAMIIFDPEGSGLEDIDIETERENIANRLSSNGFTNVEVIILRPELEILLWLYDSNKQDYNKVLKDLLDQKDNLYHKLKNENKIQRNSFKSIRPKETFKELLKQKRIPVSATNYKEMIQNMYINTSQNVNPLQDCNDLSFKCFYDTLIKWYS